MLFKENISLRGSFKFDVYQADGTLRSSSKMDNFITSTGLSYPSQYAFADCFRYLSLGSGNLKNTISSLVNSGLGTTGLQSGLAAFAYIGGHNCDGSSNYESTSCGFREEGNKVVLSRGWRIPAGDDTFTQPFIFKEFMVSPGRPPVVDIDGSTACSCYEYTTYGLQGLDGSYIASYYTAPSICSGDKAFARVVKNIEVATEDFLVVTYDLNVSFNTGINNYSLSIVNANPLQNWTGTLTGKTSLIHHGIKTIFNGVDSFNNPRSQIPGFGFTAYDYGESVVSSWGTPMEPSTAIENVRCYLSTDNVQYLVNKESGSSLTPNISLSTGSGAMCWHPTPTMEARDGFPDQLKNARRDGARPYYPYNLDYTQAIYSSDMSFDVQYMDASRSQHTSMEFITKHARSRTGNYSFQFWGNNAVDFQYKPIRAMMLGYIDNGGFDVIPFFDTIFLNRAGKYPTIHSPTKTYSIPNEEYLSTTPTGYFYMENGGILTMTYRMSWSSPCDVSVDGC
jgi:hypothetical protein